MKPLRAALPALAVAAFWFACSGDPPPLPVDPYSPKPCQTVEDCPAARTHLCGMRSCTNGFCELEIYEKSRSDKRGDCYVEMCDNFGLSELVPDLTDVLDDGNPCTRDYCEETEDNASSLIDSLPAGPVPNGSGFCNGRGYIVECLKPEDCGDVALTCSRYGKCVPLACANDVRDEANGEPAIDCGGPCDGCPRNRPCNIDADCGTGVCGEEKRCAEPSCDDGIKNGEETDVDCGGTYCDPCTDGQGCVGGHDCVSRSCFAGRCQPPACDDAVRNGDEVDIDCGADCPPCQF